METNEYRHITNFFIVGINYKKTDASIRGQFAINNDQYEALLQQAKASGLNELFVLSTCNRTEVYGFANSSACCAHKPPAMQLHFPNSLISKTATLPSSTCTR